MKFASLALISLFAFTSAFAQDESAESAEGAEVDKSLAERILEDLESYQEDVIPTNTLGQMSPRKYATLRVLDRLNGKVRTVEVGRGETVTEKFLTIEEQNCFVPADNGQSDAIAFLKIQDSRRKDPSFDGWMIASSPALNALEHPRYDVWVVSCADDAQLQAAKEVTAPPDRPAELIEVPL